MVWMVVGAAGGFLAAVWSLAGIRRARTRLSPRGAPARVMGARESLKVAVSEGRRTMREYEAEARVRWGVDPDPEQAEVIPMREPPTRAGSRTGAVPG